MHGFLLFGSVPSLSIHFTAVTSTAISVESGMLDRMGTYFDLLVYHGEDGSHLNVSWERRGKINMCLVSGIESLP